MSDKQEIVEMQAEKQGFFSKLSNRIEHTGTKTLVVLGVGVALLIGGGFLVADMLEDRFEDAQEMRYNAGNRVVDRDDEDDDDSSVATTNNQAGSAKQQATTNAAIAPVETSELDGTYTATVYNETYTLTIKGNQGTLQTSEADGEQELESVVFDLDKKVAYVDDDAETYTFDGKTLVLTEVENDLFDKDQITFTKQ